MVDNMNGKAINKIHFKREMWDGKDPDKEKPVFEVIIKQGDEVVYHNKAHAGVVNLVQSINEIDYKEGIIDGDSQVVGFGHPVLIYFAWDQIRVKSRDVFEFAIAYMYEAQRRWKGKKARRHLKDIAIAAKITL